MKANMTIIVVLMALALSMCSAIILIVDVFPQGNNGKDLFIISQLKEFILENGQEKDGKMLWNKSIDENSYNVIVLSKKSLLFGIIKIGTPPIGAFFIASFGQEGTKYSYFIAAFQESDFTILEYKDLTIEEFEKVANAFYRSITNQDSMEI